MDIAKKWAYVFSPDKEIPTGFDGKVLLLRYCKNTLLPIYYQLAQSSHEGVFVIKSDDFTSYLTNYVTDENNDYSSTYDYKTLIPMLFSMNNALLYIKHEKKQKILIQSFNEFIEQRTKHIQEYIYTITNALNNL